MSTTLSERFWAKVDVRGADECWEWMAARNNCGYGVVGVGGHGVALAHRVAYELLVGPIPEGLELDHLCFNRLCVDPDHLEPVTHAQNMARVRYYRADQRLTA